MRDYSGVGDRFRVLMRTEAGSAFQGTVMPAKDDEGAAYDYSSPRLVLRTRDDAVVRVKDLIITPTGERYLVAEHYAGEVGWRSWRLFKAERQMAWTRKGAGVDTLTGLPKATSGAPTSLGLIWATTEISRRVTIDPGLKIPSEQVVVITNKNVKEGDNLDGKNVVRANSELGLYILEIR